MSDWITLTLRTPVAAVLAMDALQPDQCAGLSSGKIAATPIRVGNAPGRLGDLFDVDGERSPRVRIEGSTGALEGLGTAMRGGELVIAGDTGARTGAGMAGGRLQVRGRVGPDAGVAMSGGRLLIEGDAGDRLGSAAPGAAKGMTGGEIVVRGSAGDEAGARMRRGLIVVAGDVGRDGGRAMIAGTLVVFGRCGEGPGRGSKRGSIVACGPVAVPATYRYACTFRPPHLRLTWRYLEREYGLAVADLHDAAFRRYCGDAGDPGKGEILERVAGV